MSRGSHLVLLVALVAIGVASEARGAAEAGGKARAASPAASWVAALRVDRLRPGTGGASELGGSAEADALWRFADGATLSLGARAFRLADVEWVTARLGGSRPLDAATTLFGGLELGPGRQAGGSPTFFDSRLGVTRKLGSHPLWTSLEGRYLDFGDLSGSQLRVSVITVVASHHRLAVTYGRSPGARLGEELFILRWDGRGGGRALLAGVARGTTLAETLTMAGTVRGTSLEIFAGAALLAGRDDLSLLVALQELEGASRVSLTFVARGSRRAKSAPRPARSPVQ